MCVIRAFAACGNSDVYDTDGNRIVEYELSDTQFIHDGFEEDWQLFLLGEWKAVQMERTIICSGEKKTETLVPKFSWRIDEDYFYYETTCYLGEWNTCQYGYVLRRDSIMLREETEYDDPWWTAWWVIDTLSQERLVLTSADSDTCTLRLTLQRISGDD